MKEIKLNEQALIKDYNSTLELSKKIIILGPDNMIFLEQLLGTFVLGKHKAMALNP